MARQAAAQRTVKASTRQAGGYRGEFVYEELRKAIHTGRLRAGDRIREVELAESLDVSRTPVRDALRRLESDGLVTHAARRGLVVTELTLQQISELYGLREVLEGMATGLAAKHASDVELRTLEGLLEAQREAGSDADALLRLDYRFHDVIHLAGGNRYLISALNGVRSSLSLIRVTSLTRPKRQADSLAEHEAIMEAVRDHDVERAERAVREHIRHALGERVAMAIRDGTDQA